MVFKQSEKWSFGFWLGLVTVLLITVLSIVSRSWSVALMGFIFVALSILPRFMARLSNNAAHMFSIVSHVFYGFLFFLVILVGIERMYLDRADSYPRWLASGELGTLDGPAIISRVQMLCKDQGMEIFQKSDMVVVRCGYSWFGSSAKTYIADRVANSEK